MLRRSPRGTMNPGMGSGVLEIDGSYGEGGGQILRTALALSCLTGTAFRMVNIRRGRERPGLMPQHLMSVVACRRIASARTDGEAVGSQELTFVPSAVAGGSLALDVGTAGSVGLILHALLPPLFGAASPSSVTLRGGTHVPFSPPFHHVERVFLPVLARTGRTTEAHLLDWGFYPRGGGHVRVRVIPRTSPGAPISLFDRGELRDLRILSVVAGLPLTIAERQMDQGVKVLRRGGVEADIDRRVEGVPSRGNGTFFFIEAHYEHVTAGFGALGAIGKRAEEVGREAAEEFLEHHATGAPVDPYLGDQLLLYAALDGAGGYAASRLSEHLLTNAWVIGRFLPAVRIAIDGAKGGACRVGVST